MTIKIIIFKSSFLLVLIKCLKSDKDCCFQTNKAYRNNEAITLKDFDDLKSLKFNCSKPLNNISFLKIKPNKQIILDDSLEINELEINSDDPFFALIISNFKGFDLNSNPFKHIQINLAPIRQVFQIESKFDFYLNKTILIDQNNCDHTLLPPNLSITSQAKVLNLEHSNTNTRYTCPFVFQNSYLYLLTINNLHFSLIFTNSFQFYNVSIENNDHY